MRGVQDGILQFLKKTMKNENKRPGDWYQGRVCGIGFVRGTCVERCVWFGVVRPSSLVSDVLPGECTLPSPYPCSGRAGCSHIVSLVKDYCGSILVPSLCQTGTSYIFSTIAYKCNV